MFNPFADHEKYSEKRPEDMSIQELRMLLKIKRQSLELGWMQFQNDLQFWQRLGKAVQKSGILEHWKEKLYPTKADSVDSSFSTESEQKENE